MKYLLIVLITFNVACAQDTQVPQAEEKQDSVENESAKKEEEKVTVNWMTINEALAAQKENPKKIFIDFYTHWCGPCKLLDKKTFQNNDVAKYLNDNFYAVKFNAEGNEVVMYKGQEYINPNYKETKGRGYPHQFSQFFGVRAYPTMAFLDEEASYLAPVKGYLQPTQLEPYLKIFGSDKYKEIDTQEKFKEYLENFENEFSDK